MNKTRDGHLPWVGLEFACASCGGRQTFTLDDLLGNSRPEFMMRRWQWRRPCPQCRSTTKPLKTDVMAEDAA